MGVSRRGIMNKRIAGIIHNLRPFDIVKVGDLSTVCVHFPSAQMVPMPQIEDSKDRTCAVVGLHFVSLLQSPF
ncbi:hypothetical protein LT330_008829 [Penicillium expansum]|nr:hypothetical protein LT330_008829 [Penicillium expansum]